MYYNVPTYTENNKLIKICLALFSLSVYTLAFAYTLYIYTLAIQYTSLIKSLLLDH